MLTNKNICFVIVSNGIGGAETVLKKILLASSDKSRIFLIVNNEIIHFYYNALPSENILNLGNVYVNSRFLNRFLQKYISIFLLRKKVKAVCNFLRGNNIGSVISTLMYDMYLLSKLQIDNVKRYSAVHGLIGVHPQHPKFIFKSKYSLSILKKMDGVICVSDIIYQFLNEFGEIKNICLIDNGVDKFFDANNKISDKNFILYCGGSKHVKGSKLLIAALKIILSSGIDVNFKIAGHVEAESEWFELQRRYKNNISIVGFVDEHFMQDLIAGCSCVIMPSLSEGGKPPLLAKEAISLGKTVLASNIEAFKTSIPDAYRFELNESSIQEKIMLLLHDQKYRNGFRCNEKWDSWEVVLDKYIRFVG